LECLSDEALQSYLLQLAQLLKNESYHDSALARFLLRRAFLKPKLLGHTLFWLLKSEMHILHVRERYGLILEQYLRNSGRHRIELGHQVVFPTPIYGAHCHHLL
jgi:phosphatidylinositol-4,5-bisphosphate 3-kinase